MKLLSAVVCLAVFAAALGAEFKFEDCIQLDAESELTFTATIGGENKPNYTFSLDVDPLQNEHTVTGGSCPGENGTAASMTVFFNKTKVYLDLYFFNGEVVTMSQLVSFVPLDIFGMSGMTDTEVTLDDKGTTSLSSNTSSFQCDSTISFTYSSSNNTKDNMTYTITQTMSKLRVQAFNFSGNFSTAEHCSQDEATSVAPAPPTTEAITTEAPSKETSPLAPTNETVTTEAPKNETTTEAPKNESTSLAPTKETTSLAPTNETTTEAPATTTENPTTPKPPSFPAVKPVAATLFEVKDKETACFLLQAGLQLVVEYMNNDSVMVFTKPILITPETANVTGTCTNGTTPAMMTMTSNNGDFVLTITETKYEAGKAESMLHLKVMLKDIVTFPDVTNRSVVLEFTTKDQAFQQDTVDTFYMCNTLQQVGFNNTLTALVANTVKLQAFGVENNNFTGDGAQCSLDPQPKPAPAGDNKYTVSKTTGNETVVCIMLQGEITFSNITYMDKGNKSQTTSFSIPAMNETTKNVMFTGDCGADVKNATKQMLTITFYEKMNLTMTFAMAGASVSGQLGADQNYHVQDIEFNYVVSDALFPNASDTEIGKVYTARVSNLTDFMQGSVGGSYLCNSEITTSVDGVQLQTTNLQYMAFNDNNKTAFNDNVSECPADDESNSIVPIAVGAALAGLVVIVLIAYLIGRRRSRRQGYESV